jgi:protein-S-isoprenylcysteine O-methyltransferase Ste14
VGKPLVRSAIRQDLLYFALPAFLFYVAGIAFSGWDLFRHVDRLFVLSVHSIAGLALIVAGLTICIVSAATLGRSYYSFLAIREDHRLITHGVYRYARHPIYLGALMVCIGVAVYAASLLGLLMMLVLIPLVLNRIRMEEKMLVEEYGDAYRAYQETTKKLIPFVY